MSSIREIFLVVAEKDGNHDPQWAGNSIDLSYPMDIRISKDIKIGIITIFYTKINRTKVESIDLRYANQFLSKMQSNSIENYNLFNKW